ncbi:DUF5694 domain-containing protein [Maricaulis sp.]|uniref:DUF5694 domain-containing protein n=1 Tax=Maricaulis sp. TaxID=1486257 RepID=UPI0026026041|nr:DUF5694 domain-containing protein [Maricaulis sp.]
MIRTALVAALAAIGPLALSPAAPAQTPPRPEPVAEILILGTYHFANPGRDRYNAQADDMLSPRRQAEIEALADRLAEFRPTIVAVEADPGSDINERYADWRAGEAELTVNERQQIGFRLAGMMDLDSVAPVDASHRFMAYEDLLLAYRELAGGGPDPHLAEVEAASDALGRGFTAETEARQAAHTVGEVLAWMNTDAALDANHDFYLAYSIRRWGADGNAGGAHTVGNWYTRNILIFQNILKQVEDRQGDRVLVVVGQGHAAILRHLADQSPWVTLVNPLDYLPEVPDAPE